MANTKRKTVSVTDLVAQANKMIGWDGNTPETRDSEHMKGARSALGIFIEHFLIETNNYRGFAYVSPEGIENDRGQYDRTLRRYSI